MGRLSRDLTSKTSLYVFLCYAFLAVVLPFMHTDCIDGCADGPPRAIIATLSTAHVLPAANSFIHVDASSASSPHHGECLACEWSQSIVSGPQIAFSFVITPVLTSLVEAPTNAYSREVLSQTPSRAPPTA